MKALVVEDDFVNRLFLQEILKEYGPLHVAVNGREAVDAVCLALEEGVPYDLICLDIMMPGMDGQRALKEIRSQEEARGIPSPQAAKVVITTSLSDVKNVQDAFQNLCDAYLIKPIHRASLLEVLRTLRLIA